MTVSTRARVTLTAHLELNESETRALDALVGYGNDSFIEAFYTVLGRHYMRPHEAGLRTLFDKVRQECGRAISDVDTARALLAEAKAARQEAKSS